MRIFAAVLPPAGPAAEVAAAVTRLRRLPGADRLRWTDPAGWHLTLAFYGDNDPATVREVADRLARAARRTPPFPVRLHGGGQFGERALWAAVGEGQPELTRLAARATAAGRRSQVAAARPTGRAPRFRPHLTLARATPGAPPLRPYREALEEFAGGRWQATRLTLVHSELPAGGTPGEQPRYTTVASWPLRGTPRRAQDTDPGA